MKKAGVLVLACVAALSLRAAFMYESTVTVSGYRGGTTLSGFPVLLRLAEDSPSGFSYSKCRADGGDIAFLSEDGATVYPHEIERWDANDTSLVWVRLPSLSGTNTKFLFRFGDPSCTDGQNAAGVWGNSAGRWYAGVWHFAEEIAAEDAGTTLSADSALHDENVPMDATPMKGGNGDFTMMYSVAGVVGNGRQNASANINGNNHNKWNGNYLNIANYDSFGVGSAFTVSGWFIQNVGKGNQCFFSRGDRNTAGTWGVEQNINYVDSPQAWCGTEGVSYYNTSKAFDTAWRHIAIVFDGTSMSLYVDGERVAGKTISAAAVDNGLPLKLGRSSDASWHGSYDEIRLLGAAVSNDWIKAEYDSVARADFVTAAPVQTLASDLFSITAEPQELGTVTPSYQDMTAISDGDVVVLSAPAGDQILSATLKCRVEGWKLYRLGAGGEFELVDSAATNAYRYVHQGGTTIKFAWQVRRFSLVSATASGPGAVSVSSVGASAWCEDGEAVVSATPTPGNAFSHWEGDLDGVADVQRPEIEVSGFVGRSLTAVFRTGSYAYRYKSMLTAVGYAGGSSLTNFPVLVRLSPETLPGFRYEDCRADGSDIAFFSPDGRLALAHEIDTWDTNGVSLAWVRLPLLQGSETQFDLRYGAKAAAGAPVDPAYAWKGSNGPGYAGVWHFGEDVDETDAAAGVPAMDSARHPLYRPMDAVPKKSTGSTTGDLAMMTSTNGQIGVARRIASEDISVTHNTWNGNFFVVTNYVKAAFSDFAVSGWFLQTVGRGYQCFFASGATRNASGGWGVEQNINYVNFPQAWIGEKGIGVGGYDFSTAWRHLALVLDGTNATLYVDGVAVGNKAGVSIGEGEVLPFTIGRDFNGGASLHGYADEVRIMGAAASADWIKAEFDTVNDPGFVVGERVRRANPGFGIVVK